ncbi:NCS2 family permease [Brevibacillus sp. SYP-B805]|uniref:solute carrier family 23 protein n=1 Tax=Brevibacillus sp. SYP-B805 TaxID=1578199 RepID=UPI0013EB91FA|nr:NCS2 family permease [Brevibacillus sp. SYP-B805]
MRNYFEFDKLGTNYRREIIAGITTFLAMAYILAVNPFMLSGADLPADVKAGHYPPFDAVFTATALAAAIGTLVMAFVGRLPIAQAPGMGLNAFFTFTVVLTMGIPWQQALAGVFVSCSIFLILSLTGVREAIVNSIPQGLKYATSAGIGLFIAFIGLKNAGIIVANPATFVGLGHLSFHEGMKPEEILAAKNALLAVFGLVVTAILMSRKVNAAIFFGMVITAVVGMIFGLVNLPTQIFSLPPSLAPTFGAAFPYLTDFSTLFSMKMLIVIFTFLFVDFFDATGTLLGVANQAGLLKDGKLPRPGSALASDAIAGLCGSILGTSTTTSYIESAAGVAAGGRSGFASVVTGILFLLSLFISPILSIVTPAVTAPALIIVGVLMAAHMKNVAWDQMEEALPAFLTVLMMPLTFSIASGIAAGFIVYPITKLFKGQGRDVHPVMYVLFFVFLAYFIWLRE